MDKFEAAQRDFAFEQVVIECRDLLRPIIEGQIERAQCVAGTRECYGGVPGKRKTTMKDAAKIAKVIEFKLNKAINEFNDSSPDN